MAEQPEQAVNDIPMSIPAFLVDLSENTTSQDWPRFSMGRAPPRNRRNRRHEGRIHVLKPKKVRASSSPFQWPAFPLSIHKHYDMGTQFLLAGFPRSSVQAVQHFYKLIAPPPQASVSTQTMFFSMKAEDISKLSSAFYENIRARWAFRKLFLLWKYSRCKLVNDCDPITLEAIKEPIQLTDIRNKAIYKFESSALARSWRSNLLNHDGVFPEPKLPTNPLTNLTLSILQIHSALKIIRKTGHLDWVLDSFASSNYDLVKWQKKFGIPLKIESLNSILADKSSYDRFDMLMDFAELQFDFQGGDFPKRMFEWIFLKHEVDDYAEIWIRACKKYYVEKYTLTEKDDLEELDVRSSITNAYLVEIPTIVKVLYDKYLERIHGRRRLQNRVIQRQGNGAL